MVASPSPYKIQRLSPLLLTSEKNLTYYNFKIYTLRKGIKKQKYMYHYFFFRMTAKADNRYKRSSLWVLLCVPYL